jgi:hypothetical protein
MHVFIHVFLLVVDFPDSFLCRRCELQRVVTIVADRVTRSDGGGGSGVERGRRGWLFTALSE